MSTTTLTITQTRAAAETGHVAILCASYPPRVCGIGDYSSRLASSLREQGVAAMVWTTVGETEPEAGLVSPTATGWDAAGVRRLVADLREAHPPLVHLQYERSVYHDSMAVPILLPILLRRAGIPLVSTFHALDGPRKLGRAHRLALLPLWYGSRNVSVCSLRQESALRRLPGVGGHTKLIPVGSFIPVTSIRPAVRRPGPPRLLYFGFIWRGRNLELVMEALKAIRSIPAGEGAVLDVIGGIRGDDYEAELRRLAADLGIADAVRLHGMRPAEEVSDALANADMVMMPFDTGVSTGRTTLMSAFDHGTPILTFSVPDNLSPVFRDGENMSIARNGDHEDYIARAVALAADVATRDRLSAGAARLSGQFSWSSIADQVLSLDAYRDALPNLRRK